MSEPRAWTAAQRVLPADLTWMISLDLRALGRSPAATRLLATALARPEVAPLAARMEAVCGIALPVAIAAIDSIVIGSGDGTRDDVVAVVALDPPVAAPSASPRCRPLADDVVALRLVDDVARFDQLTGGGLADDRDLWAGLDTGAPAWGFLVRTTRLAPLGVTMHHGRAALDVHDGGVSIVGRLMIESGGAAAMGAAIAQQFAAAARPIATGLRSLFETLVVEARGPALLFSARVDDPDLVAKPAQ